MISTEEDFNYWIVNDFMWALRRLDLDAFASSVSWTGSRTGSPIRSFIARIGLIQAVK